MIWGFPRKELFVRYNYIVRRFIAALTYLPCEEICTTRGALLPRNFNYDTYYCYRHRFTVTVRLAFSGDNSRRVQVIGERGHKDGGVASQKDRDS